MHAVHDQLRGRAHIHDLRSAGESNRACTAHHQQRLGRNPVVRAVDPRVIVLGAIEHRDGAFEGIRIFGIRQEPLAEVVRNHTGLHDRAVEQVTRKDEKPCGPHDRVGEWPDDPLVLDRDVTAIVADRLSIHGRRIFGDQPMRHQLGDDGRDAARAVVIFAEILAGGL